MSAKTKIIVLHMKEVIIHRHFPSSCCHPGYCTFFSCLDPVRKKVPQPMPKACTNREFYTSSIDLNEKHL